jgi:hypothetical protein
MKRLFLVLIMLCGLVYGSVKSGVSTYKPLSISEGFTATYHLATDFNSMHVAKSTDFNDTNSLILSNFHGFIDSIEIDPNGSATGLGLGLYYDPPEPNSTMTVKKLYPLFTPLTISAASDYFYALACPIADNNQSPPYGIPVCGDVYIHRSNNWSHSTVNDLIVYVHGFFK